MPSYQILLFGIAKDLLKSDKISYAVEQRISAGDLLSKLKNSYPVLGELPSLRIAVDHHFPKPEFLVEENMEIALIPPVSGG
jgi:molybdopterin converting factor small subunit